MFLFSDARYATSRHSIPHTWALNDLDAVAAALCRKALVAFRNSPKHHGTSQRGPADLHAQPPRCTGIHVPSLPVPVPVPVRVSVVELLRCHSLPPALNHAFTLRRHPKSVRRVRRVRMKYRVRPDLVGLSV